MDPARHASMMDFIALFPSADYGSVSSPSESRSVSTCQAVAHDLRHLSGALLLPAFNIRHADAVLGIRIVQVCRERELTDRVHLTTPATGIATCLNSDRKSVV